MLGDFGFLRYKGVTHETRVQDSLNHDGMNLYKKEKEDC